MTNKPVIRTCVACRTKNEKKNFFRIVRLPEGRIEFDRKMKRSGRGLYLCRRAECLQKARSTHLIFKALQCEVPEEIWESIGKEIHGE